MNQINYLTLQVNLGYQYTIFVRPDKNSILTSMRHVPRYTSPMPKSALRYVLEALVPYTEANFMLAFKPHAFFNELERLDSQRQYSRASLKKAYYTAKSKNYIQPDDTGWPQLTTHGRRALQPHVPKLVAHSCVMVIFDIPEVERAKRRYLRLLLRELQFTQTQQSVWTSQYDCKDIIAAEIKSQELEAFVEVYEAARIV